MTPQAAYDELVAAILKVVPDIERHWRAHTCGMIVGCNCRPEDLEPRMSPRPITLEDVLRWLSQVPRAMLYSVDTGGSFLEAELHGAFPRWLHVSRRWHLGHDFAWHLINAPETILFLHSLLP